MTSLATARETAPTQAEINAVIAANPDALHKPGVLGIRAGFKVVAGWPTRKPAIVVTVATKSDAIPDQDRLPEKVGGIAVDVREASKLRQFELTDPDGYDAIVEELPAEQRVARFTDEQRPAAVTSDVPLAPRAAKPTLPYTPPDGVALTAIDDQVRITCCASPDAGWPVLAQFLSQTQRQLTVGIYDFTSAHVLAGLTAALNGTQKLDLVLDHPAKNPTADQTDDETHTTLTTALGERLRFAWALEGSDRFAAAAIYPNAYHIKVAVQDSNAFWLSSGNWNNSNQPDIDPVTNPADAAAAAKGDRDWHVVIEHPQLAQTFAAYLNHDLTVAADHQATPDAVTPRAAITPLIEERTLEPHAFTQFFAPQTFSEQMRIQPLLTPDPGVYQQAVLQLIQTAEQSLYIQTQYAHPSDQPTDQAFTDLLTAVTERQKAGVDVRIIFSQWETVDYLEKLQAVGFDLTEIRIQQSVHNKGIVRDSTDVLISSENWSADGVLRNRDAGVIISHPSIAQYFQQIFLHDWNNLARQQALDG